MPNHAIGANKIYDYSKKLACSYPDDPEMELAANILLQAISDLLDDSRTTPSRDCGSNRNTVRREAINWFLETEPNPYPFAFENLCSFLSLDADRFRSLLISSNLLPKLSGGNKNVLARGLRRKN